MLAELQSNWQPLSRRTVDLRTCLGPAPTQVLYFCFFLLLHPLLQDLGLQVVDDSGVLSVVVDQGERKMKVGVRQAHGKTEVRGNSLSQFYLTWVGWRGLCSYAAPVR